MDSEVIHEVLEVEKKAQDIVEKARSEVKDKLRRVQAELERESHERLALARKQRDQAIEKASAESLKARKRFEAEIEMRDSNDGELYDCAENIASQMIPLILHSDIGDAL